MSDKVREGDRRSAAWREPHRRARSAAELRQACCDPALLKLDDGVERPSAKLDRLMELLLELLSEGRQDLVFSQFTSHAGDLIETRCDADGTFATAADRRHQGPQAAIDGFQNGDEPTSS